MGARIKRVTFVGEVWGGGRRKAKQSTFRLAVMVTVTVMSRKTCGSCARVIAQIEPLVRDQNAQFQVEDVDTDPNLAMEFGDRVPVILVNDEEIACWEIDDDELLEAIAEAE